MQLFDCEQIRTTGNLTVRRGQRLAAIGVIDNELPRLWTRLVVLENVLLKRVSIEQHIVKKNSTVA